MDKTLLNIVDYQKRYQRNPPELSESIGLDLRLTKPLNEISVCSSELCGDGNLLLWLKEAVSLNASDLFIATSEKPTVKILGVFKKLNYNGVTARQLIEIITSILPKEKLSQYENGQDIDLGYDYPGVSRFRFNIFRHQRGVTIAIRPIPYRIPDLNELGLPAVIEELTLLRRGLVLITGPAGSGKTTTLAAMLNRINSRDNRHIVTLEDPIEYLLTNQKSIIHQREVNFHTMSFDDGLRSAMRENPDVIVVGELRDFESISLAIRAAETGHLVLGTLHSGGAIQSITRLLDVLDEDKQGSTRTQLAQSLQAICSQRLFKSKDNRGMVATTEVLIATTAIRSLIRAHNPQRIHEIRGYMSTGMMEQMHTFKQSMQELVEDNLIDPSCALENGEESPVRALPAGTKVRYRNYSFNKKY